MNLFQRAKPASLESAFDRYYPAVFRFFRFRGADADTANDLAASVFERALSHIDQFDPRKAQIQTWLFAIARNISINHWKSEKGTLPLDDDLPQSDVPLEELVIRAEEKERVLLALQTLDNRSREVIALKFSSELSNRAIAQLTGLSESNIGVVLYRSLMKLRRQLSQIEVNHDR
ncbi:MAG: sigma-70 family RNA polymerase sigma factor [Anaerolineales bacterium]|nr:sigma-70 family RNA polymerase sigma factor [Anaerolineales bacterium]